MTGVKRGRKRTRTVNTADVAAAQKKIKKTETGKVDRSLVQISVTMIHVL